MFLAYWYVYGCLNLPQNLERFYDMAERCSSYTPEENTENMGDLVAGYSCYSSEFGLACPIVD